MIVETAAKSTLTLLSDTLDKISEHDYSSPCKELSGATIGQHYRHIIEMFECLADGYDCGIVSYDDRKRDPRLEQSKQTASIFIQGLLGRISLPQKNLLLAASYAQTTEGPEYFSTTYHRELAYALEHAVHHMAILKIGFRFMLPGLHLPANFGIAASTVRHKTATAA
jgi:hypothetical protein